MKTFGSLFLRIAALMMLLLTPITAFAAFVSGSTGVDGDFNPTTSTTVQIPESGVLNYGTVNIPSGVTVTFRKNSKNTPVTILATGDVIVNGTINVNGGAGSTLFSVGSGGPGAFDGGAGGSILGAGYRGQGPGGGTGGGINTIDSYSGGGGGGGLAVAGGNGYTITSATIGSGGAVYGNDGQLPQIGGSGGGGGGGNLTYSGGAGGGGGGALLIASSGTIFVNGSITATGGSGGVSISSGSGAGGGSGGSIRLVSNRVAGDGTINAAGGAGGYTYYGYCYGGKGGDGRIRLETWTLSRTAQSTPNFSVKSNPTAVAPPTLPTLTISSIGGVSAPSIPKGDTRIPDIQLPANIQNPVNIVVAAAYVPVGTTVTVKASAAMGNSTVSASAPLSGTDASSTTASVNLNLPTTGYPSLITVSTTYTAVASNGAPLYAEGERVDKIRVDTAMGGGSIVTYITESGREIPVKRS